MTREIPLTKGAIALVDADDYPMLCEYRWRLSNKNYAIRSFKLNGKETVVTMHRQLLMPPRHLVVDHINHCTTDNRRVNLRLCTHSQNQANRRLPKSSSTGYKGVSFQHNRWHASIGFSDASLHMGFHDDLRTAALVYDCAARRLYGEFAQTNLPDQAYSDEVQAIVQRYLEKAGLGSYYG